MTTFWLSMRRTIGVITLACVGGLGLPAKVAAQPNDFNLSAVPQFDVFYPPNQWIPIRVEMRNRSDHPVSGFVQFRSGGSDNSAIMRLAIHVPEHATVARMAMGYLPIPPEPPARSKTLPPPASTVVEFYSGRGEQLSRSEFLARPLSSIEKEMSASADEGCIVVNVSGRGSQDAVDFDIGDFRAVLKAAGNVPFSTPNLMPARMPRDPAAYAAVQAVVFDAFNPDDLDIAQRRALETFVRAGGVLVLAAPDARAGVSESWLADWMPARLIGQRQADGIEVDRDGKPPVRLDFSKPRQLIEAIAAENPLDTVALRDVNYVHAAWRSVGLGRVVFTSFPITALKADDERTVRLWRNLLRLDRLNDPLASAPFHNARDQMLASMIGRSTPPWALAAGLSAGYLVLVLGLQAVIGGAHRPRAFAATVGLAVIATFGLGIMSLLKSGNRSLMSARVSVLGVSGGGGGLQRDFTAYVGSNDRDFGLRATSDAVTVRPEVNRGAPVTIALNPMRVPDAGVQTEVIQRLWQARGAIEADRRLEVAGRFSASGLMLSADNGLGTSLTAPVLIWDGRAIRLDSMATGKSSLAANGSDRNPRGDFKNAGLLAPQSAVLRGALLESLYSNSMLPMMSSAFSDESEPQVAGWIETAADFPSLVQPDPERATIARRAQVLVRTPVRIEPSEVGSTIRIDSAFIRMMAPQAFGLYDPNRREWVPTAQGAPRLLLGFAAPPGIGQVRPERATFSVDVGSAPESVEVFRRLCRGGKLDEDASGELLAQWDRPLGQKTVGIDVGAEDLDSDGVLWLLLKVEGQAPGGGGVPSQWNFREVRLTLDRAEVIGPPAMPDLLTSEASRRTRPARTMINAAPIATPVKKTDAKKPAVKKPETKKPEGKNPAPKKPAAKK